MYMAENSTLLDRVSKSVDINHIITQQRGEEVERLRQRPDNRIHQWLDRLNTYIRWDADRFSFPRVQPGAYPFGGNANEPSG
jgi:hypothetical protein